MKKRYISLSAVIMFAATLVNVYVPTADAIAQQKAYARSCTQALAVGHRGYVRSDGKAGPNEDTVPSMLRAFNHGAESSETDWRMNADRTWYQMHDESVDRTTNGRGNLADLSDAQVAALRTPAGNKVMSFERTVQVFAQQNNGKLASSGKKLQFELKNNPDKLQVTSADFQRMLDILDAYGVRKNVYWTSSVMSNLTMMHSIAPEMEYQFIASGNKQPDYTKLPGWIASINMSLKGATGKYHGYSSYLKAAKAHGHKVAIRGVDNASGWEKALKAGSRQIITDNIGGYTKWCRAANR